jgi:hypothetical protein
MSSIGSTLGSLWPGQPISNAGHIFCPVENFIKITAAGREVINPLGDDFSTSGHYTYKMEDSLPNFRSWTPALEEAFPGYTNGYPNERYQTITLFPSGERFCCL